MLTNPLATTDSSNGMPTPTPLFASPQAVQAAAQKLENAAAVLDSKIMIVDDEEYNILVFRKFLQAAGFRNIVYTDDSTAAVEMAKRERPDVLLLDVMMPRVNGLEILATLVCDPRFRHLPVIILTASTERESKNTALSMGATDFLSKPIDKADLIPRVRNALVNKLYQDQLARAAEEQEQLVKLRTAELEASRREMVYCLARAADYRDDCTGRHVIRVGRYVGVLARAIHYDCAEVELLELAAQLHDVGKIGIPDEILRKPGKFSPEEFALMQRHCPVGLHIIQPLTMEEWKRVQHQLSVSEEHLTEYRSPLLTLAALIAGTHHERWDGNGYPQGLRGTEIPIEGRITAVADVFDSLSSVRPYKPAYSLEASLEIIQQGRGTQFDPQIVDAFFAHIEEIIRIRNEQRDPE